MSPRRARVLQPVGWREWVKLPELSPLAIKAKIDTGARTSSLHAFDLTIEGEGAEAVARFEVHPVQRSAASGVEVCRPITAFKSVRPSSGHAELRPVIRTPVMIGTEVFDIEVTLTSRDAMGFRMLLGRSALRRRFTVDPGRSYLQGDPA